MKFIREWYCSRSTFLTPKRELRCALPWQCAARNFLTIDKFSTGRKVPNRIGQTLRMPLKQKPISEMATQSPRSSLSLSLEVWISLQFHPPLACINAFHTISSWKTGWTERSLRLLRPLMRRKDEVRIAAKAFAILRIDSFDVSNMSLYRLGLLKQP